MWAVYCKGILEGVCASAASAAHLAETMVDLGDVDVEIRYAPPFEMNAAALDNTR